MSAHGKPHGNSPLQTLPEERQAQIIEWLKTGTYDAARKQLASDGFKTSVRALSEFFSWYQLRQQFTRNQSRTTQFMEELQKFDPTIPAEKIKAYGDVHFGQLAIEQNDNEGWTNVRRTEQRDRVIEANEEKLRLEWDKFEFNAAKACLKQLPELKAISTDKSLDDDARIKQIRLRLFGRTPE